MLAACITASLKFYSLPAQMQCCIKISHVERRGVEAVWSSCSKYTDLYFLSTSQRPQPQKGATLREWTRWPHAESTELLHLKPTPQSLLPGKEGEAGRRGGSREEGHIITWGMMCWDWMKPTECIMKLDSVWF